MFRTIGPKVIFNLEPLIPLTTEFNAQILTSLPIIEPPPITNLAETIEIPQQPIISESPSEGFPLSTIKTKTKISLPNIALDFGPLKKLTNVGIPVPTGNEPGGTEVTEVIDLQGLPSLGFRRLTSVYAYSKIILIKSQVEITGNFSLPLSEEVQYNINLPNLKLIMVAQNAGNATYIVLFDTNGKDLFKYEYFEKVEDLINNKNSYSITHTSNAIKVKKILIDGIDYVKIGETKHNIKIIKNNADSVDMLFLPVNQIYGYVMNPTKYPQNYLVFFNRKPSIEIDVVVFSSNKERLTITQEITNTLSQFIEYYSMYKATNNISYISFKLGSSQNVGTLPPPLPPPKIEWDFNNAGVPQSTWSIFISQNSVPIFFRPPPNMNGAKNKTTVVMVTPASDYKTEFFIAYGTTLGNYSFYDLTDLLARFAPTEEEVYNSKSNKFETVKRINFRNPQSSSYTFVEKELKQLIAFLVNEVMIEQMKKVDPTGQTNKDSIELINLIKDGIKNNKNYLSSLPPSHIETYISKNPDQKDNIYKFFKLLFESGQYMRYWEGQTKPYNLFIPSGKSRFIVVDQIEDVRTYPVSQSLIAINEFLRTLPKELQAIISRLQTSKSATSLYSGLEYPQVETIGGMIALTIDGNYCIGYGNTRFIATASFYIYTAMKMSIEGWEPSKFVA